MNVFGREMLIYRQNWGNLEVYWVYLFLDIWLMMRITKWANYKYSTEVAKTLQVKEDAGGLRAAYMGGSADAR